MPKIMYNGKEYPQSVPYKDLQGTLVAGAMSITFTDSAITTGRTIDYFVSKYGVTPTDIAVSSGSVVFSFNPQTSDINITLRIS